MSKQVFVAPTKQKKADIPQKRVKVPEPIDNPTKKKASLLVTLLPMVGMFAMVGMMALMAMQMKQSTGQINVMSMMYPLMIVPMMLPMLLQGMGGGVDIAELNADRVQFAIAQREAREEIHDQGARVHGQQTMQFPAPDALINYVGNKNADYPVMWRVNATDPGGLNVPIAEIDSEEERRHITYAAYLSPRVGVGTVRRIPFLDIEQQQPVPELLEPATMTMWRRFIIINQFMPAMPVALNLGGAPFYEFLGDDEAILGAARAMICSLAFNHSPADLKLAIISPDIDKPHWDWMKWLPNVEDAERQDRHGPARRAYRSLEDFVIAHRRELDRRTKFMTETENSDRWIVFIDAPGREVLRPTALSEAGVDGISFVILRSGSNNLVTDNRNRFRITAERDLVSASGVTQAKVDQLDVLDARLFGKRLSKYTASASGMKSMLDSFGDDDDEVESQEKIPTYFEVLGIKNIDDWDPSERWEQIKYDSSLKFPIGYRRSEVDIKKNIPTPKLEFIDLIEMARGGFPHGAGQGVTGAGKSFLLTAWIATMCALFGPDRLNLSLVDMKGGSAFNPFKGLPHVSEIVTNLGDDTEFVSRFGTVLRGEVQRRQELLAEKDDAKDIYQYREFQRADPERFPPLPDLVVFIDEFGKFMEMMKEQPENRQALVDIGRLGRSLGVHLLAFSQELDEHIVGSDLWQHFQFFVSLQASTSRSSLAMVGLPIAEFLEPGAAIIKYKSKDTVPFSAFNWEAEYTPIDGEVVEDVDDEEIVVATDTSIVPFTLENHGLQVDPDVANDVSLSSLASMLDDAPADTAPARVEVPREKQMLTALVKKLRDYDSVKARKLWMPTLREPVTMHSDVMRIQPITDIDNPSFQIGLIDDAYGHTRPPFMLTTEGKNAHVCFYGDSRTGLTQSLAAVIGSASISHDPELASFYVVDPFGASLSYVSEFINVGSYASQTDTDLAERIIGEALRLIEHRENAMAVGRHPSFGAYFRNKQINPDPQDPYGRYYLVIDRLDQLLERDPSLFGVLMQILRSGGSRGVHLLSTAVTTSWRWEEHTGFVYLSGADVSSPREMRVAVNELIPDDYPGRTVAMYKPRNAYLPARILIPTLESIEPLRIDPVTKKPVWPSDYSALIRDFGQQLRAYKVDRGVAPALPIQVVSDNIPFKAFWDGFKETEAYIADRRIALGARKRDLQIALAPPSHLIVSGNRGSGRTNTLRVFINSLVQTYSPAQAQIFIADPSFQLRAESDQLTEWGFSMRDHGYAYDADSAEAIGQALVTYAEQRVPDLKTLTHQQILEKSFYSGPDLYVLIDDYARFNTSTSSFSYRTIFDEVAEKLGPIDVGIKFILTLHDNELSMITESGSGDGIGKVLEQSQAPILGLSGNAQTILRPRMGDMDAVRFSKRRPGEGMLYDPREPEDMPVIQLPLVTPWAAADTR